MASAPLRTDIAAPSDDRREQILKAALSVISDRGFPDTRIADVAEAAGVSPALVIYYFKTKDRLLTEAMRYAEDVWYADGASGMARLATARQRLEHLVRLSSHGDPEHGLQDSWALWLDLWAQAVRNPEVARVREEFDAHWRLAIRATVEEGQASGEFHVTDVENFVLTLCSLMDGLAVQIALDDPDVDADKAFEITMRYASVMLGLE